MNAGCRGYGADRVAAQIARRAPNLSARSSPMYARSPWARRRRTVVGAAAVVVLFAVPSAHAGPLVDGATSCDSQVLETPFRRWGDLASYVLAPNGTAENAARWTLGGGAGRALGNEIYYVHAPGERYSLALPPGSSATTASICVALTVRRSASSRATTVHPHRC